MLRLRRRKIDRCRASVGGRIRLFVYLQHRRSPGLPGTGIGQGHYEQADRHVTGPPKNNSFRESWEERLLQKARLFADADRNGDLQKPGEGHQRRFRHRVISLKLILIMKTKLSDREPDLREREAPLEMGGEEFRTLGH